MTLRVLEGGGDQTVEPYAPAQFDLQVHSLRPGMAHERLELALDADHAGAVEAAASAEGIPSELWAAIAIESERALRSAAAATGTTSHHLQGALNDAAVHPPTVTTAQRGRRLAGYARALRTGARATPSGAAPGLVVVVPYHTLLAWELGAAHAGAAVEWWACALLGVMPQGRTQWEAAAAEAGQTLSEWVALQAARRASC
jgi:hypothetical protein